MTATIAPKGTQKVVGTSVLPDEALPLLLGEARFVNDIRLPGMLHMAFLRSVHAHARIISIDVSKARAMPGVVLVLTAQDLADKVEPFRNMPNRFSGGESIQHWLAVDKVRYFGEAVVAVVAIDRAVAEDAVELIEVEYDPLPPVTSPEQAMTPEAPRIHEGCPQNLLIKRDYERGDVDEAFRKAHLVLKRDFRLHRKQALPMEGRGCVSAYGEGNFVLTCWISHQLPNVVRHYLARHLHLKEFDVRVVTPHTGGGFGQKASIYPEEFVTAFAALKLKRPVKWVEDRLENMVASTHARDQFIALEAAVDQEGRILGLKSKVTVDVGAYSVYVWSAGMEPLQSGGLMPGPYKIGAYRYSTCGVATNKTPVGPYRAVGRPSASAALELLMDDIARHLKLDPVDIRLINLIQDEEMPFRSINNLVHDRVSYVPCLKLALQKSEYSSLRAEQHLPRSQGRVRGIGVSCYAELTGLGTSTPVGPGTKILPGRDAVTLRLEPSGVLIILASMPSQGQRIATAMCQVASDELGMPLENIKASLNDTASAPYGFGTFASRTAVLGSGAVIRAARELRQRILVCAAYLMAVAPEELDLIDGRVQVRDTDRAMALGELAEICYFDAKRIPLEINPQGFEVTMFYDPYFGSFAGAAHVAVVDIDPETGFIEVVRYVAAEDTGNLINPEVVKGQIIGGIAQGLGEVLMEELVFDENGQPITVTLADFLIPTTSEMPHIELHHIVTPSAAEGGFKGCGEGSQIGAVASVACAINDALSQIGGTLMEFPASPVRVLQAIPETEEAGA